MRVRVAGLARRVDWVLRSIGRVSRCAAFKAASILFWRDAETEPVLWGKDKGRERPSRKLSGGKPGNARTLRRDEGREAFNGFKSQECPCFCC